MREYLALLRADLDLFRLGLWRAAEGLPQVAPRPLSAQDVARMAHVARAVRAAALCYRPGARCLPQALAVARLLRREGFPVTFVVAVRRFPFAAHAWVECGERLLTDRQSVRAEFIPILERGPSDQGMTARASAEVVP